MPAKSPAEIDAEAATVRGGFEYHLFNPHGRLSDALLVRDLNEMGREGWDVCASVGPCLLLRRTLVED